MQTFAFFISFEELGELIKVLFFNKGFFIF